MAREASPMLMIALCSSLVGAVLGTGFRVWVLFPAMMLGLLSVAALATLKGSTVSWAITAAMACVIPIQLGYLGGLFTRFCMAAVRGAPQSSLHSTTAPS